MKRALFAVVLFPAALGCGRKPTNNDPVVQTTSVTSAPTLSNNTPPPLPPPGEGMGATRKSGDGPGVQMGPLSFAPVAKTADPSVVTILAMGEPQRTAFGRSRRVQQGLGTGFIVSKDGVIVTNNHVIEEADSIKVRFSDEREIEAKVAGRDPRTDIAAIKIDTNGKDLPAIALGDSDQLDVGDWVVAIGNPFGLSHTVSAGIVSGKGRERDDVPLDPTGYYSFIQTDASINPGNSGGPLLNLRGEVIGMNSAIRGGGAQGIGFAIPINMIKTILPTLLAEGKVTRSALGVRILDARYLTPEDRTKLAIGNDDHGAVIEDIERGGPADKAKLEQGDLVVAFDGQAVDRSSLLQWKASTAGVGKTVNIRVVRQGKPLDVAVTLGELKEPKRTPRPKAQDQDGAE